MRVNNQKSLSLVLFITNNATSQFFSLQKTNLAPLSLFIPTWTDEGRTGRLHLLHVQLDEGRHEYDLSLLLTS